MTALQIYDLIKNDGNLWKIATVKAMESAGYILRVEASTPNTYSSAKKAWATEVFADPEAWVTKNRIALIDISSDLASNGHSASEAQVASAIGALTPA